MAEMIPRYFYRNRNQPIAREGERFEKAIFDSLKNNLDDNHMVFYGFKTYDEFNAPEIDFLVYHKVKKTALLMEVKAQKVQSLAENPYVSYENGKKFINVQLFNASESFCKQLFSNKNYDKSLVTSFLFFKSDEQVKQVKELSGLFQHHPGYYLYGDQDVVVEGVKTVFQKNHPPLIDESSLRRWIVERWGNKIENRLEALDYDGEKVTQHANRFFNRSLFKDFNKSKPRPLLIHGYAGTGKTEIIKLSVDYLNRKDEKPDGIILVFCWNEKLRDHFKELFGGMQNVRIFAIENFIQQIGGFVPDSPQDFADAKDLNLEEAFKKSNEAIGKVLGFEPGQVKALFIDESQDFEEKWFDLLMRLYPPTKLKWITCYDSSQAWKPNSVKIDSLKEKLSHHDVLTLRKCMRSADRIRRETVNFLRSMGYQDKEYLENNNPRYVDQSYFKTEIHQGVLSSQEAVKKINSLLKSQDFMGNLDQSQVVVLTSQSNDRLLGLKEGAWVTRNEFSKVFPDIPYDTILRSKGLEYPAVIAIIDKKHRDFNRQVYLAASRAILSFHCIFVNE